MPEKIDLQQARQYRKKVPIRAFYNADGATYFKSWGDQHFPGAHYVVVGPAGDIYGCAVEEFKAMYEPVSGAEDTYRKQTRVRALRMDAPFTVQTVTSDGNIEVEQNAGQAGDWLVEQAGGERQVVSAESFEKLYEPVP